MCEGKANIWELAAEGEFRKWDSFYEGELTGKCNFDSGSGSVSVEFVTPEA